MAADPALAAEVQSLQETTARLGLAAAEPAPASLRASVMAEVDRTRQVVPEGSSDAVVVPMRRRASPMAVRLLGAAAAILAVLTLGLSAWVVGLRQDNAALTQAGAQVTRVLTAPDAQPSAARSRARPDAGRSSCPRPWVVRSSSPTTSTRPPRARPTSCGSSARTGRGSAGTFQPGSDGGAAVELPAPPVRPPRSA